MLVPWQKWTFPLKHGFHLISCIECITTGYQSLTNDTLVFLATLNQTLTCFEKNQQVDQNSDSAACARCVSINCIFLSRTTRQNCAKAVRASTENWTSCTTGWIRVRLCVLTWRIRYEESLWWTAKSFRPFYQWDLESAEVCFKRYKVGFLPTTAG